MASRSFFIHFPELPIQEADVKAGKNSPEVIVASRCVNVALFISGDLRRDVKVSICIGPHDNMQIFTFSGESLKRVSPDERSISFFLMKAKCVADELAESARKQMDNGIVVRRTSVQNLFDRKSGRVFFASGNVNSTNNMKVELEGVYIYEIEPGSLLEQLNLDVTHIPRPHSPERFILDINMTFDSAL